MERGCRKGSQPICLAFLKLLAKDFSMSPLSVFSSPFLLGFDELEQVLTRISKTPNEGYPPYNIERFNKGGDDTCGVIRITLAVAGFSFDDLTIGVEEQMLVIRGKQHDDSTREFLHRGIATRQFQRSFVLAEGLEVEEAVLANGLLSIMLIQPQPVSAFREIPIRCEDG